MIFISYRRADSEFVVGLIHSELIRHFRAEQVFVDYASIPGGKPFADWIKERLGRTKFALVLIGPDWCVDRKTGACRLQNPADLVRIEVETALSTPGVEVIPVCVMHASVPSNAEVEQLPSTIHPLFQRNAMQVRPGWDEAGDLRRLVQLISGRPLSQHGAVDSQSDIARTRTVSRPVGQHKISGTSISDRQPSRISTWLGRFFGNRRAGRISQTCPRCNSEGKLTAVSHGSIEELRCENIVPGNLYDQCGFSILRSYQSLPKILISTIGVASVGKTCWVAMVNSSLKYGEGPRSLTFERIETAGGEDFDRKSTDLLEARSGPSATQLSLPEPLLFRFVTRSSGWLRRWRDGVVGFLDFAGPVSMTCPVNDDVRRRQLKAEGFCFFIDARTPAESQLDAFLRLREHLRAVANDLQQVTTPIAVCVTRLDVAADGSDNPWAVAALLEDLRQIDEQSIPYSMDRLKRRSAATADVLEQIWPQWRLESQLQGLFGDRFLFFPMTAIGLPPEGMVDTNSLWDLTNRPISPYGVLDPVMWILHMHGYRSLEPD